MQHGVVVLDAEVFEDGHGLGADFPARGDPSLGILAGELLVHLDGLCHDLSLLLLGQEADILMGVSMKAAMRGQWRLKETWCASGTVLEVLTSHVQHL